MSFYKITWNEKYGFATLHNWGCTFKCPFCSYKLKSGADGRPGFSFPAPGRFLSVQEQKDALLKVNPQKVNFMGGEPTVAKEIGEMLSFAKNELGAETRLGHTNGNRLDLKYLDGANIGFKAWSENLHKEITGRPKSLIYDNFSRAYDAGLKLSANMVFVPGLVGMEELEGLAGFLAGLSPDIPFHIMGYIPVPGLDWKRPTVEEMDAALLMARSFLKNVDSSHLSSNEALNLTSRDDRFQVSVIAGD